MRKKIVAGNWKMNKTALEAIEFVNGLKDKVKDATADVVVCPTFTSLSAVVLATKGTNIKVGAQNIHWADNGAFTGEVSGEMLKEAGVEYVIIGHSERRQYQYESDSLVAKKATKCLSYGITPLICIGEDLATREAQKHLEFVGEQVLNSTNNVDLENVIIAYEPVWAIGTGKVPTTAEIDEMEGYIKDILHKMRHIETSKLTVVYGGSVKSSNAKEILSLKNVNGVLVGGASMKGEEFFGIVKGVFNY